MSLTQPTGTTEPLPVVIIGKRVEIGKAVAEFLQPDIEGTYFNHFSMIPTSQLSDMKIQ